MATDTMYFGSVIPSQFNEVWYANMKIWEDRYLDNQMARKCLFRRTVPATTEQYDMTRIDVSAEEITPQARKNAPKENLTIGGDLLSYRVYRLPTGFFLSEDDLAKQPELQNWHVEAGMSKIYRAEDKLFYAGNTGLGITGFKAAAEANSKGTVSTNNGAWLTDDGDRNIYEDIKAGRALIGSKYKSNLLNLRLALNADTAEALWQIGNPESSNPQPIYKTIAPLFGRAPEAQITDWVVINDQIADNYAFILTVNNPLAAELIEANAITIDTNYPRVPIGNYQVIMYEDVGLAIHDNDAFAEIATN